MDPIFPKKREPGPWDIAKTEALQPKAAMRNQPAPSKGKGINFGAVAATIGVLSFMAINKTFNDYYTDLQTVKELVTARIDLAGKTDCDMAAAARTPIYYDRKKLFGTTSTQAIMDPPRISLALDQESGLFTNVVYKFEISSPEFPQSIPYEYTSRSPQCMSFALENAGMRPHDSPNSVYIPVPYPMHPDIYDRLIDRLKAERQPRIVPVPSPAP